MSAAARIVLVGGGVRSGKSSFALFRAAQLGASRVFVATAEALDEEMRARVQNHQHERDAGYRTIEAPRELARALRSIEAADVVVVDCLTLWLSNLLMAELSSDAIEARIAELVDVLRERQRHTILVSNEVGLGIVPDNALARAFRDLAGIAHQRIGACADEVYAGLFGQLLRLKPAPIEAQLFTP